AALVLDRLYGPNLPRRLFWIADSTHSEKPYSERVASLGWFHRTKRVAGRAKKLKGHCYVFAAHLYRFTREGKERWGSVLVGALLYVKGRTIPELVAELAKHLRLPAAAFSLAACAVSSTSWASPCSGGCAAIKSSTSHRAKPRPAGGLASMARNAASISCANASRSGCGGRR